VTAKSPITKPRSENRSGHEESAFPGNTASTACRRKSKSSGAEGAAWLKTAGAELVEVSLPHTKIRAAGLLYCSSCGGLSNLARYDGARYGLRVPGRSIGEMYEATAPRVLATKCAAAS